MSVQVSKTGIVNTSGEIGANLLGGSRITLKQTTDGNGRMDYTVPNLSKIKNGVKLTVSCDIELYNVTGMSRIGCEPSFYNGTSYVYIGVWTSDRTNRKERISNSVIMNGDAVSLSQHSIYIQGVTLGEGGYIIVSNPKLEINDRPTAWCPNVADDEYVGNTSGFNEASAIAQITKGYVNAPDFIEI
jgi:hypothetical protein